LATTVDRPAFRFSTNGLPEVERGRALRELNDGGALPLRLEPLQGNTVHVELLQRSFPGLGVISGVLGGIRQIGMGGSAVQASDDDLFLGVNLQGGSVVHQRGREIIMRDREGFILSRAVGGFAVDRPFQVRFAGLRVPRSGFAQLVHNLDDAVHRMSLRDTDSLRLLGAYVSAILSDQAATTPELQRLVVTQILDLAVVAIGATRDVALIARGRGVAAARLCAIKSYIEENLDDCNLGITVVAAHHRVTPRYIHRLFEDEGVTYSEFVRDRRLACAYRMLTSLSHTEQSISGIAYAVGFNDLSYFNRTFRCRYGAKPSDIRHNL